MKRERLYLLFLMLAVFVCSGLFVSCEDDNNEFEANLPNLFSPVNLTASAEGTNVLISWASVENAQSYTIQVYKDSLLFDENNRVLDETVTTRAISVELQGATVYSARVRANATEVDKNSKFTSTLVFKTPDENLFKGYTTTMTAQGTVTAQWLPKANATHLVFTNQSNGESQEFTIEPDEKESGIKVCSGIPNASYVVELHNNDIIRGKVSVKVEGDIFLVNGNDLKAAIDNAESGNTIILDSGVYPLSSGTCRFDKNIKIKGLDANNKPVLCMKDGTTPPTTTSTMLGFTENSNFEYLRFENIDFTGYVENNLTGTKVGYLINNNVKFEVTQELSFKNCSIHNLGNTPFRLQADKNQRIESLVVDGCIINEIGFGSVYAIVNINTATDIINNITFRNSTIYNFKGGFILRQKGTASKISIENCTLNDGMSDSGARYLIDLNTIENSPSISISNCIFGSTGAAAGGIRPVDSYPISGSYYTTDYVDDVQAGGVSSSIKSKMKAYSNASSDLWTSPANGDFHFKDASFAGKSTAGDPRWK